MAAWTNLRPLLIELRPLIQQVCFPLARYVHHRTSRTLEHVAFVPKRGLVERYPRGSSTDAIPVSEQYHGRAPARGARDRAADQRGARLGTRRAGAGM